MKRREFLGGLLGACGCGRDATLALLAAAPLTCGAQQAAKTYRIGFLGVSSAADYAQFVNAFLQGLRELGYEQGRNIVIDYRWADGREERLPELARELVRLGPDVIVSHSIAVSAAQRATATIPIVMGVSADPIGTGLIKSLAQPGGNTTGVTSQLVDAAPKRLELLKEIAPNLKSVAVVSNPTFPSLRKGLEETEAAARKLGIRVRSYAFAEADPAGLESMLATILRDRPDGLLVQPDPLIGRHTVRIAEFAVKNRLPAIGGARQFAVDGGLFSYGGNFVEGWRLAARYVDRILKGAKPADLPVEQPTSFELVINLKTARAMGLTLPSLLLLRANEVIQ
jgi:putative ABC transport system substrate-binding protein